MKECQETKKNLAAYFYGELGNDEKKCIESHLDVCPLCNREFEGINKIMQGADSLNADIEETMASVDWESLPAKISRAVFEKETSPSHRTNLGRLWAFLFQPRLRPVYAGLLIGVILGSFFTLLVFRSPQLEVARGGEFYVSQDFLERMELEMARRNTIDYLDRSQYLLLDFVQASPEKSAKLWQSSYASKRAKDLLSKKKYMNPQLKKFQMAKAKAICDQIEFLFFELAHLSEQLSAEDIIQIQTFIEEKQLLLKIKLVRKELEKSEV